MYNAPKTADQTYNHQKVKPNAHSDFQNQQQKFNQMMVEILCIS